MQSLLKKIVTFLFVSVFTFFSPNLVYAQYSEVAKASTSVAATKFLFDKVNETIGQLRADADWELFAAAQQILRVLQEFEIQYKESLNLTFDKVDSSQREALERIDHMVWAFSQDADKKLDKVNQMSDDMRQTVTDSWFVKSDPRLSRWSPVSVTSTDSTMIPVQFEGINLMHGSAKIEVNGKQYSANAGHTEKLVAAQIPKSVFRIGERDTEVNQIKLVVEKPKNVFAGFSFGMKEQVVYTVPIYGLPNIIGSYNVTAMVRAQDFPEKPDCCAQEIWVDSPGQSQDSCREECQQPSSVRQGKPGQVWYVSTNSINTGNVWGHNGSVRGVENLTKNGFCVRIKACGRGYTSGTGDQHVNVTWKEYSEVSSIREQAMPECQPQCLLKRGEDRTFVLPRGSEGFRLDFVSSGQRIKKSVIQAPDTLTSGVKIDIAGPSDAKQLAIKF